MDLKELTTFMEIVYIVSALLFIVFCFLFISIAVNIAAIRKILEKEFSKSSNKKKINEWICPKCRERNPNNISNCENCGNKILG